MTPMTQTAITSFAARLKSGPTAFAAWIGMGDPNISETLLREGFDCAILDWQHGFQDNASIQAGISAGLVAGKATLVRIGVGQFSDAARFLDWGAAGVIAPMINSVADARLLVEYTKYPPLGTRSWGPSRVMGVTGLAGGDYLAQANGFSLSIAMIETRAALAAVDDILAVEGIDGVLVGPSDLSIALSKGEGVDPNNAEVDAALTIIAQAAKKAGKLACAFCGDGARAGVLARRGFHLLSIGTDQLLLRAGAKAELSAAKQGAGMDAGSKSNGY